MRALRAALAAALILAGSAAQALDPGDRPSTTRDPSTNFNRLGARSLQVPDADSLTVGSAPLSSLLLKALPSGRRAVEQGQSDDQTVAGVPLSSVIARPSGRTTLTPDAVQILGKGSTGDLSNVDVVLPGGTARSLLDRFADLPVSVLEFMRPGETLADVSPAVARAIAAGHKVIRLPANSTYFAPGNATPADVTLIGHRSRTSIVSVASRATDFLAVGPRSTMENVGIISKFCDQEAQPGGTQKVCAVGKVVNASDTTFAAQNWVGTELFVNSGPNLTGPSGVVSHDLPSIQVIANGSGTDAAYFASNAAAASATRLVTSASGALGAQIFNGLGCPTCPNTYGMLIHEFGNGGGDQKSIGISRVGGAQSIYIDDYASTDTGSTAHQTPFLQMAMSHQGGGNIIDMYQAGVGFAGNFMHVNAGASGAGWTGNYLAFDRSNTRVFHVDANGAVYAASSITGSGLAISGVVGFNGAAPVGKCSLPGALPTDGSATNAAMASAYNAVRSCLVTVGLAQ